MAQWLALSFVYLSSTHSTPYLYSIYEISWQMGTLCIRTLHVAPTLGPHFLTDFKDCKSASAVQCVDVCYLQQYLLSSTMPLNLRYVIFGLKIDSADEFIFEFIFDTHKNCRIWCAGIHGSIERCRHSSSIIYIYKYTYAKIWIQWVTTSIR